MTFAVAWLAFPVVLGLLCFGCGLLLEEVTRRRLPVLLLMPMGFALVIVLVQLARSATQPPSLAVPAAVAAAAAGFGLSYPWGRIDPWAVLAPLLAYAVYAAPVVLSGDRDVHRLHQARRHGHLVRSHRPRDGARPQPRRARRRPPTRRPSPSTWPTAIRSGRSSRSGWVAPWWARTWRGSSSRTSPSPRRCSPPRSTSSRAPSFAPDRRAWWPPSIAAQPALLFGYVLWGGIKEIVGAALIALLADPGGAGACRGGRTARPGPRADRGHMRAP